MIRDLTFNLLVYYGYCERKCNMQLQRPDLSEISPAIRSYIEALEAEVDRLRPRRRKRTTRVEEPVLEPILEPNEAPTTMGMITLSSGGIAKRTLRHLYSQQRRGGMGIFDLETTEKDPPRRLAVINEDKTLLLISNFARVYHLPISKLEASPVRHRGRHLAKFVILDRGEYISLILPNPTSGALVVTTQTGQVQRYQYHRFRSTMRPGMLLYSLAKFGSPMAACLTTGEDDIFLVTRNRRAIRFAEEKISLTGSPGIRLKDDDAIAGIAAVRENSGVFLLGADGKGTIRLMEGFRANKAPGASGKVAMKGDEIVGVATVDPTDHLFIISRLSKIIRFAASDVPSTLGIVKGVNCISLRGDEAVAVTAGRMIR